MTSDLENSCLTQLFDYPIILGKNNEIYYSGSGILMISEFI